MADQDLEKKKQDTPRKADSGGNMGAGKSGKEGLGSEKPSDDPGLGSQKPVSPNLARSRDQGQGEGPRTRAFCASVGLMHQGPC